MSLFRNRRLRRRLLVVLLAVFAGLFLRDSLFSILNQHQPNFYFRIYSPQYHADKSDADVLPPPLGSHQYLSDGLVVVNPDGPHPILELIRSAEEQWNVKLERASRTLEEAVAEYKRRWVLIINPKS